MKASELRIGNYYNQFGHETLVSWATMKDLESAPIDQLWCKPIALTEEWLLKFGFIKSALTHDKGKLSICMQGFTYANGRTYFNSWTILERQPKYVHELQNLYFALTCEELLLDQKINAAQ